MVAMSKAAEDCTGLNGDYERNRYLKTKGTGGLESWPLTSTQHLVGQYAMVSARAVAGELLLLLKAGRLSCTFADLQRDSLVFDLMHHGILRKVERESGAWYCQFTVFSRSWCEFILAKKVEK